VDRPRADLVLGSPVGRLLLAGRLGFSLRKILSEQLGLGQLPGGAPLTAGAARRAASRRHRRWQDVAAPEARAAVGTAVARGDWRGVADLDELGLLAELADDTLGLGSGSADDAMRMLLALAGPELRPVADALLAAPAAHRWWQPVAAADQRFLEWDGGPRLTGRELGQAVRDGMRRARAENAEALQRHRPGSRVRDEWWSAPDFASQTWTTGAFGDVPAIALRHFIDTLTPFEETGATVWSLQIAAQARVLEIGAPEDWQELVRRFPRDVTGTHEGEWRESGGVPGPWRLPDWEKVMDHYDGVHVTIGGYVACGGLAPPVGDGYTMLTAWLPDATLWLTDQVTGARRLGRWHGDPQGVGNWDDISDGWTPDGPVNAAGSTGADS
jgi:hypothetical protein